MEYQLENSSNNKQMKKIFLLTFSFLFFQNLYPQLSVSTSMTPVQLVQNVLSGTGITVSNVSYTGSSTSRGSFTGGGGTNLGIASGIVLATCSVNGTPAFGSPVGNFLSEDLMQNGDTDLELLSPGSGNSYDASVLDFDFIPINDTINLKYVFASEEYPEWVCSEYNDVFGFFVSGPGISGPYSNNSINIAKIPGTNLPVAINSVNNGNVGSSGSPGGCISLSYSSYYVDNEAISGTTIVFDGFTVVLTAWCKIIPCLQYHLKIAISDISDAIYDSAIFLEASSLNCFSANKNRNAINLFFINDTIVCDDHAILEAPYGFDQYVWSTGDTTQTIIIDSSGSYYVTVTSVLCGSVTDSVNITFSQPYMNLNIGSDTVLCIADTITLYADSGFTNYLWNTGSIDQWLDVYITGNYSIITEDTAYCIYHDTINIVMDPASTLNIGNDTAVCGNPIFTLDATSVFDFFQWSTGDTLQTLQVDTTGIYSVTVTNNLCAQTTSDTVQVFFFPYPVAEAGNDTLVCYGYPITLNGSQGMYYEWIPSIYLDNPYISNPTAIPNDSITYYLNATNTYLFLITDSLRCTSFDSVTINVTPLPPAPNFCIATVDPVLNKNVLIWEVPTLLSIDTILISRFTLSSTWTTIARIPASDTNVFIDYNSSPDAEYSEYSLQTKDTCGNYGTNAMKQVTMHLSITPFSNYYYLLWNSYFGNQYTYLKFVIYRGTSISAILPIDTIDIINIYEDYNVNSNVQYYYYVKALRTNSCFYDYPYNDYTSSISNIVVTSGVGITDNSSENGIFIYPNPVNKKLTIEISKTDFQNNSTVTISDICGKQLLQTPVNKEKTEIDISGLAKGIYLLSVENKDGIYIKKFIKE